MKKKNNNNKKGTTKDSRTSRIYNAQRNVNPPVLRALGVSAPASRHLGPVWLPGRPSRLPFPFRPAAQYHPTLSCPPAWGFFSN